MPVKHQFLALVACIVCTSCASPTITSSPPAESAASTANPPDPVGPAGYTVVLETSRGQVRIQVDRADAPIGADRFYRMVTSGFLDGARFFRVVSGFVVQFGLPQDPKANAPYEVSMADDPVKLHNARGTLTFAAGSEPNSRTTQLFINLSDNLNLDHQGFAAIGRVVGGMDAVDSINSAEGEGPDQDQIKADGGKYLSANFPHLDYIKSATIVPGPSGSGGPEHHVVGR
jgi:peptidyl-prolyl cis-trans isomerase A (cyclophilin A)